MSDIQRADSSAKRRAVLLVIVGSIVGGSATLAIASYRPSIERWLLSDPEELPQRLATLAGLVALVTVVPLFAFAVYLWARGTSVRRYRRFPLEGERLVRDTLVIRGEAALLRGRVLQVLAIALAMLAVGLTVVLWRLTVIASVTGESERTSRTYMDASPPSSDATNGKRSSDIYAS